MITAERVCVPFTGMRSVFRKIPSTRVHFSVDTKMQVLDPGRGIATVSVSVKDGLRNTTLCRGNVAVGQVSKVQGPAHTTHNHPVLQAEIDDDLEANYAQLLETTCRIWAVERPDAPPLPDVVSQFAKDFSPGLEASRSRRKVFPKARPVDDYFHLRNKQREISCRCHHVIVTNGKRVKKNFDWILACLDAMHTMPTIDMLSECWEGFLQRLRFLNGPWE